jgi:hypothetical protein
MTYREAVRMALREALQSDPRVFLMWEVVGRYGGAFQLSGKFPRLWRRAARKHAPIRAAYRTISASNGRAATAEETLPSRHRPNPPVPPAATTTQSGPNFPPRRAAIVSA